jgi:hypothetical protein
VPVSTAVRNPCRNCRLGHALDIGLCRGLRQALPANSRWLVHEHAQTSSLPVLPRISGKPGLGATLFRLATSLYEQAEEMNKGDGLAAIGAYLDILSLHHAPRVSFNQTGLLRATPAARRILH